MVSRLFPSVFILTAFGITSGCVSYSESSENMRQKLYSGQYTEALETLEKSSLSKDGKDKVLYHMEKGTILYVAGEYEKAAHEWGAAGKKLDELYTVSLSSQAASLTVNDSMADYEGEAHERMLLTTLSAIAFLADGKPAEAAVEARRAHQTLKVLSENKEKPFDYKRDVLTLYLNGLIYEMQRDWDSAIIDYRSALEAAEQNKGLLSGSASEMIAAPLARLAEFRRRPEILSEIKGKYPSIYWQSQSELAKNSEIIVVFEAGKSPIKVPEDVAFPIKGQIVRLSFPVYKDVTPYSNSADVYLDNENKGRTTSFLDVNSLARKSLEARRGKDLTRLAVRSLAKGVAADKAGKAGGDLARIGVNILGVITETADTRSWTTLPKNIQLQRFTVEPSQQQTVTLKTNAGEVFTTTVNLKPGEKRIVRFRSFR